MIWPNGASNTDGVLYLNRHRCISFTCSTCSAHSTVSKAVERQPRELLSLKHYCPDLRLMEHNCKNAEARMEELNLESGNQPWSFGRLPSGLYHDKSTVIMKLLMQLSFMGHCYKLIWLEAVIFHFVDVVNYWINNCQVSV